VEGAGEKNGSLRMVRWPPCPTPDRTDPTPATRAAFRKRQSNPQRKTEADNHSDPMQAPHYMQAPLMVHLPLQQSRSEAQAVPVVSQHTPLVHALPQQSPGSLQNCWCRWQPHVLNELHSALQQSASFAQGVRSARQTVAVAVGLTVLVAVLVPVAVASGVFVAVALARGVLVAVAVPNGVFVAVAVAVAVCVAVHVTVPVFSGVFVAVALGVCNGVNVAVVEGVLVATAVPVGVEVPVAVGVDAGVAVPTAQFGSSQLLPAANVSPTAHDPFTAALCSAARPAAAPHDSRISRI